MRKNNYWRHAGNAKWGLEQLFRDVRNHKNHRKPFEQPINNKYREGEQTSATEGANPPFSDSFAPVNNYYNYASQPTNKKIYRYPSFWDIIRAVAVLSVVITFTYFLITNPEVLFNAWERVVQFFHSI